MVSKIVMCISGAMIALCLVGLVLTLTDVHKRPKSRRP